MQNFRLDQSSLVRAKRRMSSSLLWSFQHDPGTRGLCRGSTSCVLLSFRQSYCYSSNPKYIRRIIRPDISGTSGIDPENCAVMLGDISRIEKIYIRTGYTDMRKQLNGLVDIIQYNLSLLLSWLMLTGWLMLFSSSFSSSFPLYSPWSNAIIYT